MGLKNLKISAHSEEDYNGLWPSLYDDEELVSVFKDYYESIVDVERGQEKLRKIIKELKVKEPPSLVEYYKKNSKAKGEKGEQDDKEKEKESDKIKEKDSEVQDEGHDDDASQSDSAHDSQYSRDNDDQQTDWPTNFKNTMRVDYANQRFLLSR